MAKFFEFEKKFGWAELISLLALMVAFTAFLQSRGELPNVVVTEETPSGMVFYDTQRGQWRCFTYNRLLITNLGGPDSNSYWIASF